VTWRWLQSRTDRVAHQYTTLRERYPRGDWAGLKLPYLEQAATRRCEHGYARYVMPGKPRTKRRCKECARYAGL